MNNHRCNSSAPKLAVIKDLHAQNARLQAELEEMRQADILLAAAGVPPLVAQLSDVIVHNSEVSTAPRTRVYALPALPHVHARTADKQQWQPHQTLPPQEGALFPFDQIAYQQLAATLHNMMVVGANGRRYRLEEYTSQPEHKDRLIRRAIVTVCVPNHFPLSTNGNCGRKQYLTHTQCNHPRSGALRVGQRLWSSTAVGATLPTTLGCRIGIESGQC